MIPGTVVHHSTHYRDVKVKIETSLGTFEESVNFMGGIGIEGYTRRLLVEGYWLNSNQTDWLAPSQIKRVWLVSLQTV